LFDLSASWSVDINSSLLILLGEIILRASTWTSRHLFWIRHHHLILTIPCILKAFLTGTMKLLIVILRKMIRVNHRKHLRKSLTDSSDSLAWISEWKFSPWLIIDTFSIKINYILGARGTRGST
jgi:hypothetical protein